MKTTTSKADRLLLLFRLPEAGAVTDDLTLQTIGDALGMDRSAVIRDLRVLDQAEAEYHRLMALQPWTRQYYTVVEFAAEIGAHPDTVRAMIRDGLVRTHKRSNGRWAIPIAEVERFRRGDG